MNEVLEHFGEVRPVGGLQSPIPQDLPVPTGFRMLVKVIPVKEKIGSIYMPDSTKKLEDTASPVAQVVLMGDLCYLDKGKFPLGPWCKVGDFIIMRSYSGTRIDVQGEEYRLLNDEAVEAVLSDPSVIARAY